ncbi:hypothetical protein MHY87_03960 [Microvirga sp. ACRRW]|uniref:hypothetical protein n=1 Tax=Microvirga sp. ACRRW TaxID=2918205 RepID=UPI001EF475A4|nr:hypothetical protein [Microvirga sp. ACRRW]MCG7392056.1 hypothetical protein [Microvirga sp. ACRRW]
MKSVQRGADFFMLLRYLKLALPLDLVDLISRRRALWPSDHKRRVNCTHNRQSTFGSSLAMHWGLEEACRESYEQKIEIVIDHINCQTAWGAMTDDHIRFGTHLKIAALSPDKKLGEKAQCRLGRLFMWWMTMSECAKRSPFCSCLPV